MEKPSIQVLHYNRIRVERVFSMLPTLKAGKIDVYDKNFAPYTGMSFSYPGMDPGFAPYNIVAIGRFLYVAYAQRRPDGEVVRGPGLGFVNIYSMRGAFIRRLASGPELNAPWGIAGVQSDPYSLYPSKV